MVTDLNKHHDRLSSHGSMKDSTEYSLGEMKDSVQLVTFGVAGRVEDHSSVWEGKSLREMRCCRHAMYAVGTEGKKEPGHEENSWCLLRLYMGQNQAGAKFQGLLMPDLWVDGWVEENWERQNPALGSLRVKCHRAMGPHGWGRDVCFFGC
jgi:hypothetical protein